MENKMGFSHHKKTCFHYNIVGHKMDKYDFFGATANDNRRQNDGDDDSKNNYRIFFSKSEKE